MGYSLTGHQNGPAPAEATGLEVDKFNRQYVKNYLDRYLKTYSDTVGSTMMGEVRNWSYAHGQHRGWSARLDGQHVERIRPAAWLRRPFVAPRSDRNRYREP